MNQKQKQILRIGLKAAGYLTLGAAAAMGIGLVLDELYYDPEYGWNTSWMCAVRGWDRALNLGIMA